MKWILAIVLIVAVGAGFWWYQTNPRGVDKIELAPATSKPDPSNGTFEFEDGSVTLKNGSAVTELSGSVLTTETTLGSEPTYGDINGDKKNDAVVLLIQNSGGSGIFVYIAAYVSGNVTYKGSNAIFVGDRISPQTTTVNNDGLITLTYLDRKPDEAMAATPTIPVTKTFVFKGGRLEER